MSVKIIGAGLAGLITACRFKMATIFEAGDKLEQHKALLRFRDKSVSELTGIPFQEVTVHKEIAIGRKTYQRCSIAMANMYSRKVTGTFRGRSIWNLETVKRYVAPPDFYERLVQRHGDKIEWNTPINEIKRADSNEYIINTAPLHIIMKACGLDSMKFEFSKSTIRVTRYRLPKGTQAYQTIYFPDPKVRVFRASITGDMLIVESMAGDPVDEFTWRLPAHVELNEVCAAFGFDADLLEPLEAVDQKYGKIIELPKEQREAVLYELTREFNVFSVGRFATWRNILLDDVVKDIDVVERLMGASNYGRGLVIAGR